MQDSDDECEDKNAHMKSEYLRLLGESNKAVKYKKNNKILTERNRKLTAEIA
jgi:hypothetical protein